MRLSEAEFSTRFYQNYHVYMDGYIGCGIEHKICDNTFNIKGWKNGKQSHQYHNLIEADEKGFYWKIPDENKSTQRPFDGLYVTDGVLIIWFNKHQKFAILYIADVDGYGDSVKFGDISKDDIYTLLPKPEKKVLLF